MGATARISVTLFPEDVEYLDRIASTRSEAVRKLIEGARKFAYITHLPTGRTYAARYDSNGRVIAAAGPLSRDEIYDARLHEFNIRGPDADEFNSMDYQFYDL